MYVSNAIRNMPNVSMSPIASATVIGYPFRDNTLIKKTNHGHHL